MKIQVLDPGNREALEAYTLYRSNKPGASAIWTADRVRTEICSTVLAATAYRNEAPRLDIEIGFSPGFWVLSVDLSDDVAFITGQNQGDPALCMVARDLLPWNVRLHVWPAPLACYEHLRRNRTESQLIHAHGWDLLSIVLDGELEERTYGLRNSSAGRYKLYTTRPEKQRGVSFLEETQEQVEIDTLDKTVRAPHLGAHFIPSGVFHSTLPARPSISLVAAKQIPGQISHVAVHRGAARVLENTAPEQSTGDEHSHLGANPPETWASFAFFTHRARVLLVRTVARPHQWHPVGGRREAGDSSPVDTLVREIEEEVGTKLDPSAASWLGSRRADSGPGLVCFWKVEDLPPAEPLPCPPTEIVEARWWEIDQALLLPMFRASTAELRRLADTG